MQGASGVWAGQQIMKALNQFGDVSMADLRTLDTLRKDEWLFFDETLIAEAAIRLRGVANLLAAGLVRNVPNSFGKTMFEWEKISDMSGANVSMDGMVETENDRVEFTPTYLPLPITHKDFHINMRTLIASRNRGEALDTTQVRIAGRVIAEKTEEMLFLGGKSFGGTTIYGYTTHPDRNKIAFGTGGDWNLAAKTGEQYLADILSMIGVLEADRYWSGPYWLYIPSDVAVRFEGEFKTQSDRTIRERLLSIDRLAAIVTVDQLPSGNVILTQATEDVAVMVQGEPLQTIQWDYNGGMQINFKALQISVPLIRSDPQGRSGVVHMNATGT